MKIQLTAAVAEGVVSGMKWSLSAEFFACILLMILLLYFYERRWAVTARRRMYGLCLWLSLSSVILNTLCVVTIQNAARVPLWVNLMLNSAYFLISVLMCSMTALYLFCLILEHVYDKGCLRRARRWVSALTLIDLAVVLWNLGSGVMFSFDAMGNYQRGPLNRLGYGIMAAELALLLLCYFKNQPCVSRDMVRVMRTLPPVALLLMLFQLLYPELLLNGTIIAMADLILFLGFQCSSVEQDGLTGIGNRNSFYQEISLRLAGRQRFQVILLSLHHFVNVNQRFGHAAGDAFLYEIARWLDHMEPEGRAFRFGNVEFALLLPWESQEKGRSSLETVQRRFQRTWTLGDAETLIPARLTDLVCRGQAWTEAQVLELLEHGLRLAKQGPEETVECGEAVWEALERRKELLELIRRSIRERRFRVWYQPVYRCGTGAFSSAEALLRLEDFQGRAVPPSVFIPLAEETGLIDELSWIVLEEVCRLLGGGQAAGLETVSINLSMQQFMDPDLTGRVTGCLARHGVSPERLKIEITERVLLQDLERMRKVMGELSAKGVRFYLDDFGTGYSNLSSVLDLPFECIKLDQSLLVAFPEDRRADMLVHTLLELFHKMGQRVVVEGVETAAQAEGLRRYDADWLQGYYYARPLPEERLLSFLLDRSLTEAR
ncbi:EAL domain-containing protein [Eubacteriales bacterium SGI.150]